MKESEKKQKLNQALKGLIDERIASYIREHVDEIRNLLGEDKSFISDADYQDLHQKYEECQQKIESLQNQLQGKNDELQQAKGKLSALKTKVEPYQHLEAVYQQYLSLPEMLRVQLQGIFGQGSSALAFYKEVVQPKRIENFYDYLAQCINNVQDDEKLPILKELLNFCIDEASYERMHVEIGREFDSQQMKLAAGSPQLGTVERVLLDGYRKPGDRMPVRKSIVCIGDR
ncbi:hypothetical protein [Megasphaera elsdenii]|uniref:hypothetical protein n=1 Tax=Megasphaera elsdenii TaxID=907 RepID=UPI0026DC3B7A|nr:hypothetical protein [Megasphaera elsdenii]